VPAAATATAASGSQLGTSDLLLPSLSALLPSSQPLQ
jgi:hypothetical protein